MSSSSSEDKDSSTTGAFPEEPPCSNTGERGRREDTSDGDPGGGGDLDGVGGGVLASLGVGLSSVEREHSHLRPLLSSIVGKQRARDRNPKLKEVKEKEKASWFPAWNRWVFITQGVSCHYSHGCRFGSRTI
jgi:hypothetical protein